MIRLDCRSIEPSAEAFLRALNAAVGGQDASCEMMAARLARLGDRVILALDTYEVFRMLDTWLRREFVPSLEDNVRVVLVAREPPVPAWLVSPGWQDLFHSVTLGPLGAGEAAELLLNAGVPEEDVERVNRFAHGHPLALTPAAAAISD